MIGSPQIWDKEYAYSGKNNQVLINSMLDNNQNVMDIIERIDYYDYKKLYAKDFKI